MTRTTTRHKIPLLFLLLFYLLLVFCCAGAEQQQQQQQQPPTTTVLPSSSSHHVRPTTTTTKPPNTNPKALSTHLQPPPSYMDHIISLTLSFLQTRARALLLLLSSNCCTARFKVKIVGSVLMNAVGRILAKGWRLMGVCKRNYAFLKSVREDERRRLRVLSQGEKEGWRTQTETMMMTAVIVKESSSSTPTTTTTSNPSPTPAAPTAQPTISVVAPAEFDTQDILPVILRLENTVRRWQRFSLRQMLSRLWMRARRGSFAVGFLGTALCAWVGGGVKRVAQGVLGVGFVVVLGRYLMEGG